MVRISGFASGLGLTALASGLSITGPDSNGVKVSIGFDKNLASSNVVSASMAASPKTIKYDTAALLKMGKLEAEASNHTEPVLHGRTVFGGKDERQAWTDSSFPYRSIGRIASSGGYVCTGTLIGPRHIITARHCTPTSSSETIRFQPFYYNGETRFTGSQVTTYITSTSRDGDCLYGQDWAIHILADRLGDQLGYFGSRAMTKDYLNRGIFYNFGYAGDLPTGLDRPIRSAGGTMQQFGNCAGGDNPTLGNIDVSGGQSGGPMWDYSGTGDRMLMGTLYGANNANSFWASGQAMVNAILQSRKDFP